MTDGPRQLKRINPHDLTEKQVIEMRCDGEGGFGPAGHDWNMGFCHYCGKMSPGEKERRGLGVRT